MGPDINGASNLILYATELFGGSTFPFAPARPDAVDTIQSFATAPCGPMPNDCCWQLRLSSWDGACLSTAATSVCAITGLIVCSQSGFASACAGIAVAPIP